MSFDYEKSVWGRGIATTKISDPTSIRLRRALKSIKDLQFGDKVLEIGCGAGQFIRGIKLLRLELDCYGVDISENAIKNAEEAKDGVKYSLQKTDQLPFEDGLFSSVIILDVLEHVENWQKIISEAKRVLKPDGVLYIFVPCEGSKVSVWNCLRKLNIGKDLTNKYAGHINYFNKSEIFAELKIEGLNFRYSYSEHILGQLLGVVAFFAMDREARKAGDEQMNNEQFFGERKSSALVKIIKNFVNSLVFIESWLLQFFPSPNLHLVARKK